MPTYRFYNTKTKTEYEDLMSISEMEEFIKQKHIKLMPPTKVNIVSSTGGIDSKTDSGWKDTLSKISEKHPNSPLAERYGPRESIKKIKTKQTIAKHRARKK
jgi:hypothetical protein|tara:strand:- start:3286 stop:3591 length:306 start_codon:yes stop_codon:yes gene_type:complete